MDGDGPGLSEEVPPGIPSMPGRPALMVRASSSTGVKVIGGPDPVCRLSALLRLALKKLIAYLNAGGVTNRPMI